MKKLGVAFFLFSVFLSCKKEEKELTNSNITPPSSSTGSITVKFENYSGANPLVLNTVDYVNANGDTFKVSLFNYYISNIKLIAADSSIYSESESYHLIQADLNSSLQFSLPNIPIKNYVAIQLTIGVDSLRNVSGAQSGALDPVNGMFWSWNSGYIMAKIEGTSPQSGQSSKLLKFHVGGFSGVNNSIRTLRLAFPNTASVSSSTTPVLTLKADVLEWFKSPSTINFATTHTVHMPGTAAKIIADNYSDMISVSSVQNP